MVVEQRFRGRVVVVTGAAGAVGTATAHRFAGQGAAVVVLGSTAAAPDAVARSAPEGTTVLSRVLDPGDGPAVTGVVDAVADRFGRIDVLVTVGAGAPGGTVEQLDPDVWRTAVPAHLDGVLLACRAALPHLRSVGGNVVGICAAPDDGSGTAAHQAGTAAVLALLGAMARDHAPDGVRVNAVLPGGPGLPRAGPGTSGRPADVAAAVTFLAGPDAASITGARLSVADGVPPNRHPYLQPEENR